MEHANKENGVLGDSDKKELELCGFDPRIIAAKPTSSISSLISRLFTSTSSSSNTPLSLKRGFFNKEDRSSLLLKKYKLPDASQESLEKGLRNTAARNELDDLRYFIQHVNNINSQDKNPISKKTALHWAVLKNHAEAYDLLISSGAKADIEDAEGNLAILHREKPVNI